MEGGGCEEPTLLTGPIQGDVVTINQQCLDLKLLQVKPTMLYSSTPSCKIAYAVCWQYSVEVKLYLGMCLVLRQTDPECLGRHLESRPCV